MGEEGCGSSEDEKREKGERGGFEGRGRERDGSDGRRVVMEGLISVLYGCTEAPGVYRVSRFRHSDHIRGVAAGLCANTSQWPEDSQHPPGGEHEQVC